MCRPIPAEGVKLVLAVVRGKIAEALPSMAEGSPPPASGLAPVPVADGRQAAVPSVLPGVLFRPQQAEIPPTIGDGAFYGGDKTSITIKGGVVTAAGECEIGRGTTGTSGSSDYTGSFSIEECETAVIFTTVITDASKRDQ